MFANKIFGAALCSVVFLGACAQQEEPLQIQPQPIYNKFGDIVGCEGGGYFDGQSTSGTGYDNPCEPPEEGCDDTGGYGNYPCLPPEDQDDRQPNGSTSLLS